ncbi:MAG: exodeoxyribonuclease III [Myxococcota bacterium]|nr:exodeoxyribonuclease III [Myxococcota bacterium]
MKLISWNVNGLRAALKKGFADFVETCGADIICLQEIRATPEQVSVAFKNYDMHWYPAEKKGYAGTAMLSRVQFSDLFRGMGMAEHDREGRVITAALPDYYLVTVYTPNSQRGLTRLDYRTQSWDPAFKAHLKKLERKKPVVFCGDLNVAHEEIDLANPKSNRRNAGFTDEERATFDSLLQSGFVDTFRAFCQEGGHYTWWSNFGKARERNVGWRIDYFCISKSLRSRLKRASILPDVMGSDHCPILMELD